MSSTMTPYDCLSCWLLSECTLLVFFRNCMYLVWWYFLYPAWYKTWPWYDSLHETVWYISTDMSINYVGYLGWYVTNTGYWSWYGTNSCYWAWHVIISCYCGWYVTNPSYSSWCVTNPCYCSWCRQSWLLVLPGYWGWDVTNPVHWCFLVTDVDMLPISLVSVTDKCSILLVCVTDMLPIPVVSVMDKSPILLVSETSITLLYYWFNSLSFQTDLIITTTFSPLLNDWYPQMR